MITTARSRRFPVRACQARTALADIGTPAEFSRWIRGVHSFEVRQDRLACEVRHSVSLDSSAATRLWWFAVGRPLYDQLIEDTFDNLARQTGSPVRRPARFALYSRVLRRMLATGSTGGAEALPEATPTPTATPLPLAS